MTPEKFEEEMRKISKMLDPESKHAEADELMMEALEDEGFDAGVNIFERMDKWYS